jgi:hypothetical protein
MRLFLPFFAMHMQFWPANRPHSWKSMQRPETAPTLQAGTRASLEFFSIDFSGNHAESAIQYVEKNREPDVLNKNK